MGLKKYKSSNKRKARLSSKQIPAMADCPCCKKKFYKDSKHFFNCITENNPDKPKEEINNEIAELFPVIDKSEKNPLETSSTKKRVTIPIPKKQKPKKKKEPKKQPPSKEDNIKKNISNEAMKVYIQLKRMKIDFSIEKFFDDCLSPKTNMKLPFDFYLPKHNTLIEYDGRQHFEYVKKYHGDNKEEGLKLLQEQQYRDEIKNTYCKNNGINLIRISYKEKSKIKTIIESNIKLHN